MGGASKCEVRALKDEKVSGKEPGKGVLVEQTARAKALRWRRVV